MKESALTDQTLLLDDHFTEGLRLNEHGGPWRVRPAAGTPHGDGRIEPAPAGGLLVTPTAIDEATGLPAFDSTDPEGGHLRWATFAADDPGAPESGFDLPRAGQLVARLEFGARLHNVDRHPFGATVPDPDSDLRCGMGGMICVDLQTGMVFDFALTNHTVWALYERLPRPGMSHGTFSYAVPVGEREPDDTHCCDIVIDADSGTAHWIVDGTKVFDIDAIGLGLPSAEYLARSTPGHEEPVRPERIAVGFGLFASPLWGQGISLTVRHARVAVSAGRA